MANMLIPIEERNLTPEQVERMDARRRRGQLYLVVCFQTLLIGVLMTMWTGQDLTYSPGWAHPIAYLNAFTFAVSAVTGLLGIQLKRGSNEFISY